MKRRVLYICLSLAVCAAGVGLWKVTSARATAESSVAYLPHWSPQAAADYLDRREVWWQGWPGAKVDHGTICISCHTVVPYAMIRPDLRRQLHEAEMPAPEKVLMDNVEKRVGYWSEMTPFYSDAADGPGKTAESHATEAVLNAVILATRDAQHGTLRPITRTALDAAWALQETSGENAGAWKWQDFHLAPWEAVEGGYQGAAVFLQAVVNAPVGYARQPEIQEQMKRLEDYLRRRYAEQPLMNQLYILWLSPKVPGLLTADERKTLLEAVQSRQQADGGWGLSSLDPRSLYETEKWKRVKIELGEMAKPVQSDGYATALVVLALEASGASDQDPMVKRGLAWLEQHQGTDGRWRMYSINGHVDPDSDVGRFMSDAATAYAVMALENGRWQKAEK
jgi:squalene-hopene/tetraprenyl-beta-curcumene cyclase